MKCSIITPSFKQFDWLRLCVASVRDQISPSARRSDIGYRISEVGDRKSETGELRPEGDTSGSEEVNEEAPNRKPENSSTLCVEHIIQDAGSPGIEGFAREVGADFYRDGALVFASAEDGRSKSEDKATPSPRYRIAIYCESDRGMYDAINRGVARSSGEICAWLNSDEQYLPGTLDKVAKIFSESPNLDVLLGDALLVDSKLQPVCYRRIMVPNRWHTRLDHLHSLSCAMFFKPSALPHPPLDPKWKVIGDAVLMDHFRGSRKRIRACGELLSAYAFTGANLSANPAHDEHALWMEEMKWPPGFLRPLVVLHNRLRRMVHGAYGSFPVEAGLFTHESLASRTPTRGSVPGKWPNLSV